MVPTIRFLLMQQSRRFFLKKGVQTNNTPLKIINKFNIYPYYYMCELPFFISLRKLLEKNNVSFKYVGPPKIRNDIYSHLFDLLKCFQSENLFIIIYDDMLDGLGHRFGPHSIECIDYAKKIDNVLLKVYKKLRNKYDDLDFYIFSDHGQCDRKYEVNLLSLLNKAKLKLGDDYLCFIDATIALFWSKNTICKEKIINILDKVDYGILLDEDLRNKYQLRFKNNLFGDIIFILKPKSTFFPNFFSPFCSMKGLHGYLPEESVQKSFLITDKKLKIPLKHIKDLYTLFTNVACEQES
jgi:hypothetical protein